MHVVGRGCEGCGERITVDRGIRSCPACDVTLHKRCGDGACPRCREPLLDRAGRKAAKQQALDETRAAGRWVLLQCLVAYVLAAVPLAIAASSADPTGIPARVIRIMVALSLFMLMDGGVVVAAYVWLGLCVLGTIVAAHGAWEASDLASLAGPLALAIVFAGMGLRMGLSRAFWTYVRRKVP